MIGGDDVIGKVVGRAQKTLFRRAIGVREALVRQRAWTSELARLRAERKHERCVILGTGPSLGITPLASLTDCAFCAVGSLPFHPHALEGKLTYYIATDRRFLRLHNADVVSFARRAPECTVFIPGRAALDQRILREPAPNVVLFASETLDTAMYSVTELPEWARRHPEVVPLLRTVTATAAYLTSLLGYSETYLVGCDAYGGPDPDQQLQPVSAIGDGHYYDGAASTRAPYDLMRLSLTHRQAYLGADVLMGSRGGKLYNATFGGAVDTVPRVPFSQLCRPKGAKSG